MADLPDKDQANDEDLRKRELDNLDALNRGGKLRVLDFTRVVNEVTTPRRSASPPRWPGAGDRTGADVAVRCLCSAHWTACRNRPKSLEELGLWSSKVGKTRRRNPIPLSVLIREGR